jgi:BirA family biotin operon repressor/biotin-[acetyl-CoA-carboxylase] ligase
VSYDGLNPEELARRLKAPSCLSLVKVTSALDIVHELAAEGAPSGTVVVADQQVAGRGRLGRRWSSPPKTGIWLGYLMRPSGALQSGVLAIRIGLALLDVLEKIGVEASLKWPNDVVLRDRKLAGVLCEARWAGDMPKWVAAGIGINVHRPLPPEIASEAVALDEVCPGITRISILELFVPKLHRLPDSPGLLDEERERYGRYDWLMGRRLRDPLEGSAGGIDHEGALLVRTAEGVERIIGGSVVAA